MINPFGVKYLGPLNDAVHFITLTEQQRQKISAVLAANAGDQCFLHHSSFLLLS